MLIGGSERAAQPELLKHGLRIGSELRRGAGNMARRPREPRRDPRKAQRTERRIHGFEEADRVEVRVVEQRSEEHTSELQSQFHLVCRLLLEKKKATDHP